jgi:Rrf2 family transcriptional regulator, iron-sulfur cluster assembly transcription factor
MRITTRTRYAIRALYDLAFHRLGQAAGAKEISDRQKIPLRFLEQILQDLRKAGIIEARRGPRGGYVLSRPPAKISLAEVMHAVRGPLEEMFGFDAPAHPPAPGADDVPAAVWTDVRARLVDVLQHATLQDFVARAEASGVKRAALPATMYFI